jgi:hypothetical protein
MVRNDCCTAAKSAEVAGGEGEQGGLPSRKMLDVEAGAPGSNGQESALGVFFVPTKKQVAWTLMVKNDSVKKIETIGPVSEADHGRVRKKVIPRGNEQRIRSLQRRE